MVRTVAPPRKSESDIRDALSARGIELLEYGGTYSSRSRFRCPRGHEWSARTSSVVGDGHGCTPCSTAKRRASLTLSEKQIRDRLANRDDIELVTYGGGTAKPSVFRCIHGHEWTAITSSVLHRGSGCAQCSAARSGRVQSLTADILVQRLKDRLDVQLVEYGGTTKAPSIFRCAAGHEWSTSASNVLKGTSCRVCAIAAGNLKSRLDEDGARRRLQGRGIELVAYGGASKEPATFRCRSGHEWTVVADKVLHGTSGCAVCAAARLGRVLRLDEAEVRSRLADRADLTLVLYGGTGAAMSRFRCPEGHEWDTRTDSVIEAGRGCRICSFKRAAEGRTFGEEDFRRLISDRSDLELLAYGGKARERSRFRCTASGHEWDTIASGVAAATRCPSCARSGFDTTSPAVIYLVHHEIDAALKIGITNTNNQADRLRTHARHGWILLRSWPVEGGRIAYDVERTVVRAWREAGLPPGRAAGTDGWTETVAIASLEPDEVVLLVSTTLDEVVSTASGPVD